MRKSANKLHSDDSASSYYQKRYPSWW